ncbi:MAG TPA: hypothetical protein VFE82_06235 [Ramlibacter sp.]|jgi:hypothetical protein|uniref:hypothetical protein n=1 Tax=Ramlibacter sp. TaxID=1917967 RepID=UPI002D3E9D11|nr:hypothetical protein [Ramlibacter sp.]HZY18063.1 hypothetical protein [Ramlibacter sp.]
MAQQSNDTMQADIHAYSAVIDALDLGWDWDPATHGAGPQGLRAWLEKERPHLLRAYDCDFLISAMESTRARMLPGR